MNLEEVFTRHPLLAGRERDVRRAIRYVERQSHLIELNCGLINMVSNLQFFGEQPFVLIFDEFHFRHVPNVLLSRWKSLAIAAANMDGTKFKFLYLQVVPTDVHVLGSNEIYEGLKVVVTSILNLGLAQNVCGVISDRRRANLKSLQYVANYFPVLWDEVHMKKKLVARYKDTVDRLGKIYGSTYHRNTWKQKFSEITSSTPNELEEFNSNEVLNLKKLLALNFAKSSTPLNLSRVNSSDLELRGFILTSHVYDILKFIHITDADKFTDIRAAIQYFSRVVGIVTVIYN
ncbi:uncharacterized protein [Drosophila pseudoobscura]|uniref:Uncharacterized protein n=1 Tax=Drosophila pseudoobscura pseudoobscura TaxID=46245 RepID=A0A6I8VYZ4_DROPS|nr:uncharacterized protein LOC6902717 [Drosophila pseudoobscura]